MAKADGKYYLGRVYDPKSGKTTEQTLLYDSEDLTTHCVVVGMTGSGKTGLCIDLMEEAALNGVPALIIDPKGDITNLLLHFPQLRPEDFEPWINADEAKRQGKTTAQAAAETAELWRGGLADWDISPERIQALKESAQFAVYTPGSTAGIPLSVLSSLEAPGVPWAGHEEVLGEQISDTVTALLGLVGFQDVDPVQSREHILMSNIFQNAWSQGKSLTLGELIMQIQSPPFSKLGVLDVNTLFPEKARGELAMRLNNMLASPTFQTWIQGEPLSAPALLYGPDGRPRHSVFYIAHLNDEQRMFFVTLLFSVVESWMRTQSGTTSLRALVYFDEIFGYMPPSKKPPSKEPMLRMLKQARAFGVSMVLATQNPVDIDYKGLSNAGTWFIGRLATEQDKARLIDGLAVVDQSGLDTKEYDRLISAIGKRVFLMRNVHEKHPVLFQTRWAMNYLAGPLTRTQIPALNALAGAAQVSETAPSTSTTAAAAAPAVAMASAPSSAPGRPPRESSGLVPDMTETRPAVPTGVGEYFLPANVRFNEGAQTRAEELPLFYRPVLLGQADVRLVNARYNVNTVTQHAVLVTDPDPKGNVRWGDYVVSPVDERSLERTPAPGARFEMLDAPLTDARTMKALEAQFVDWVYRNAAIAVRANEKLKVFAGPDVDDAEFERLCAAAADDQMDAELDRVRDRYEAKMKSIQDKLAREERELAQDQAEYNQRKQEEWMKHAETFFGILGKRRRSLSSSLSKRRMTATAKSDIEESEQAIAAFQAQLADLKAEMEAELDEIEAKWAQVAAEASEIKLSPKKTDVRAALFGVAWFPYYLADSNGRAVEMPAYES